MSNFVYKDRYIVKNKSKIILIFLFFLHYESYAEQFYCKNIGIADGLSQSSVTAIVYDSRGALWVGTRFGLNEYRNQKVRTFLDSETEGLYGNYITSLFLDSSEKIWVATEKGLSVYEHNADKFFLKSEMPVYCAHQNRKGLWFGGKDGLLYFNGNVKSVHKHKGAYIVGIHDLKDSLLVVDKGMGIWTYKDGRFNKIMIPELENRIIMSSSIKDDFLYLSVYRGGLYVVDLSKRKIHRVFNTLNSSLSCDIVLSNLIIGDELWVGTDGGGLCVVNLLNNKISPVDVRTNSITVLYQDPHDNIWAGSVRSGLFGLKNSPVRNLNFNGASLLPGQDVVISLCEGKGSALWIGLDGGGVNKYDRDSDTIYSIKSTQGFQVSSIAILDESRLLLSIYGRGLQTIDIRTGRMRPFVLLDEETNFRECYYGNSPLLYNIGEGKILIFAINLYEYDIKQKRFTRFYFRENEKAAELKLCADDNSSALYAYSTDGIFTIDENLRRVRRLPIDMEGKIILSAAVYESKIWIGTDHGLFSYSLNNKNMTRCDTKLFNRVTQLQFDLEGDLWIAADNTLFRMRGDLVEIFGENEGFAANEILTSAIMENKGSEHIYLGGTKGLVEISINEISDLEHSKDLILNNVRSGGRRIMPQKERVSLPSNFSSLRISVILLGADPFENVMYKYDISGGTSYSMETYDDYIELPDLKEGEYVVSCSYLERDGSWSAPTNVLEINIRPPFYRSLWFLIFIVALSIYLIVYLVRRLYKRKVRALEQRLREDNINFINKFDSYINEHLSDAELNVDAVSTYMAMSRASLYSRVKTLTGKGVIQYVEYFRMEEACRLLNETNLSVSEIADKVGYSTSRYFSTKFKKVYRISPREYRKNKKG